MLFDLLLQLALTVDIERRLHRVTRCVGPACKALGKMRRQKRQRTRGAHLLRQCQRRALSFGQRIARRPLICESLTGRLQRLVVGVGGMTLTRMLWHHGKRECLGHTELRGSLVEIDARRGTDALHVAAVRGQVQISLEYLVLAVMPLDPQRETHLAHFAGHRACIELVAQACQLHRDGRGAHGSLARYVGGPCRAHQGNRIDPDMTPKVSIFIQQGRIGDGRSNVLQRHIQPVALVGGERQAQQRTVAIKHGAGVAADGRKVRRLGPPQHQRGAHGHGPG